MRHGSDRNVLHGERRPRLHAWWNVAVLPALIAGIPLLANPAWASEARDHASPAPALVSQATRVSTSAGSGAGGEASAAYRAGRTWDLDHEHR